MSTTKLTDRFAIIPSPDVPSCYLLVDAEDECPNDRVGTLADVHQLGAALLGFAPGERRPSTLWTLNMKPWAVERYVAAVGPLSLLVEQTQPDGPLTWMALGLVQHAKGCAASLDAGMLAAEDAARALLVEALRALLGGGR